MMVLVTLEVKMCFQLINLNSAVFWKHRIYYLKMLCFGEMMKSHNNNNNKKTERKGPIDFYHKWKCLNK